MILNNNVGLMAYHGALFTRVRVLRIGMFSLKNHNVILAITDRFDYIVGRDYEKIDCPMKCSDFAFYYILW